MKPVEDSDRQTRQSGIHLQILVNPAANGFIPQLAGHEKCELKLKGRSKPFRSKVLTP